MLFYSKDHKFITIVERWIGLDSFLAALEPLLREIPERNRQSIIEKYREYFNLSMHSGKTEEEIIAFWGNPKTVARYIVADYLVERAEADSTFRNIFKAVTSSVGLGVFNLAFFLGPFLGLSGALLIFFIAGLGISFVGIEVFTGVLAYPTLPSIIDLPPDLFADTFTRMGTFFVSIGLIAFGLLFIIGDYILVGIFYRGTLKHLRFHLSDLAKEDF